MTQDEFMKQMVKAAKRQMINTLMPIFIAVGVICLIIGFTLGAIIF